MKSFKTKSEIGAEVRVLVMDVDGTLTDGKINISYQGELYKSFDVKDGYGILKILPEFGITPVIITGRTSGIVEHRSAELNIKHLYQGVTDKAVCLNMVVDTLHVSYDQVACIGDDLNDLPMMKLCGMKGCPSDAVSEVRAICDYVCKAAGGQGAVREFIEWLTKSGKD